MFARHVTVQLQPGKADEATAIFQDSVVPALQQQEGFKGAFLLIDLTVFVGDRDGAGEAHGQLGFARSALDLFAPVAVDLSRKVDVPDSVDHRLPSPHSVLAISFSMNEDS